MLVSLTAVSLWAGELSLPFVANEGRSPHSACFAATHRGAGIVVEDQRISVRLPNGRALVLAARQGGLHAEGLDRSSAAVTSHRGRTRHGALRHDVFERVVLKREDSEVVVARSPRGLQLATSGQEAIFDVHGVDSWERRDAGLELFVGGVRLWLEAASAPAESSESDPGCCSFSVSSLGAVLEWAVTFGIWAMGLFVFTVLVRVALPIELGNSRSPLR